VSVGKVGDEDQELFEEQKICCGWRALKVLAFEKEARPHRKYRSFSNIYCAQPRRPGSSINFWLVDKVLVLGVRKHANTGNLPEKTSY
jgi:hypothetical protein